LYFVLRLRPPPISPLFPYTTLFRSWGEVDMLSELLETALVQAAPRLIKKVLCGTASASKAAVQAALVRRHPELAMLLEPIPASLDRKSTRLNSSHVKISYAVFCLKK